MTPARRRRRRPGPGCRSRPPRARRTAPLTRAGALASLAPADVAPACMVSLLPCRLGSPRGNFREVIVRPFFPQARIGVRKVRFG